MIIQSEIEYLNGFLKALETLVGRQARIGANSYALNEDPIDGLEVFLRQREICFDSIKGSQVSREEFLSDIWKFSTDRLKEASASVQTDLKWQFEECLGLISTAFGQDHAFHPLFNCQLYRVLIQGSLEKLALLIQFKDTVVVLFCEKRA